MNVIVINETVMVSPYSWIRKNNKRLVTFDSKEARDVEFELMKKEAKHTGCGGMCDHFVDCGHFFLHCFETRVEKMDNMKMCELQ